MRCNKVPRKRQSAHFRFLSDRAAARLSGEHANDRAFVGCDAVKISNREVYEIDDFKRTGDLTCATLIALPSETKTSQASPQRGTAPQGIGRPFPSFWQ
jgi:hypothetical protein